MNNDGHGMNASTGTRNRSPKRPSGQGLKMKSVVRVLRSVGALGLITSLGLLAAPGQAQDISVKSVDVVAGDTTQVVLTLDRAATGTAVSAFTMSDPDRLIVDIADASLAEDIRSVVGSGALVQRVESESFDDGNGLITRVRVYLSGPADHKIVTSGSEIRLSLTPMAPAADPLADALSGDASGAASSNASPATYTVPGQHTQASNAAGGLPSGPCLSGTGCEESQLPAGPRVRALDFNQLDGVSRVVIGTHATSNYTVTQPSSKLVVVDLPGAFVPKSLRRVVDTSQFYSPVSSVRAYPTSTGTRVAISLRESTDYSAKLGPDNEIFIDLVIPAHMMAEAQAGRQSFAEVSPAGPADQGLKSAYASEVYIGAGGRTQNPQSTFNQGAGIGDPSTLLGMSAGFMVDQAAGTAPSYSGQKISLDFVNADIHSIFRLISSVSRLNIVAGDDVHGTVTVRLEDVPWDQAFAAILQAKGMGSQRFGNIVRVAPLETIKAEQQAKLETKRAREDLKDINMMVLPLNYATGSGIVGQLQKMVSSKGSVEVDERTNQIIIRETDERLAKMRELVRQLDLATPQVLIEARVVEASSNFTHGLGIQWGGKVDASAATGYPTGLFFPNSIQANGGIDSEDQSAVYFQDSSTTLDTLMVDLGSSGTSGAINLSLGSIPGLINLDARLSALESEGRGKVVSAPRVTTVDNEEATITQGERIPYLSTSAGGTSVQFVDATLELSVTPHITADKKVFMKISVTNNRADFGNQVQGQPAIQIKEASTDVLVPDGDTTVIGGVFSTEESENQSRVPGFSQIPLLGYMFKNSNKATTRNELLVFITPHIVTPKE
ncbi:MAG: type IV pilus secretin PilQ [Oligoflexia bacterium]|nr:type IV pilus secretin PilQ [Oligoflexia bacterium]